MKKFINIATLAVLGYLAIFMIAHAVGWSGYVYDFNFNNITAFAVPPALLLTLILNIAFIRKSDANNRKLRATNAVVLICFLIFFAFVAVVTVNILQQLFETWEF